MLVREIAETLKREGYVCELRGDGDVEVSGFADPSDYRAGCVIWLGDVKYLDLKEGQSYSDITLLMCEDSLEGKDLFPTVLICADPRNAFVRLLELSQNETPRVGFDTTASISSSAVIGKNVYIAQNCVIGDDVQIGDGCIIYPGCVVEHTTLGRDCVIYPNCVLGMPGFGYRKDRSLVMEPHIGRVVLGDRVEVLSGSIIERGTTKDTFIGSGSKLACLTNIGHNVTIGEDCQIIGGIINGFAVIGDRSELIRCVVGNRIKIGHDVKIGLNSTVVRDIPANVVAFGSPARVKTEN